MHLRYSYAILIVKYTVGGTSPISRVNGSFAEVSTPFPFIGHLTFIPNCQTMTICLTGIASRSLCISFRFFGNRLPR